LDALGLYKALLDEKIDLVRITDVMLDLLLAGLKP
jgi:hypothetical protein